jgi:hypothetical protein
MGGQYLCTASKLLRRYHVDEDSCGDHPAGDMGKEQNLEASIARVTELVVKRRISVDQPEGFHAGVGTQGIALYDVFQDFCSGFCAV